MLIDTRYRSDNSEIMDDFELEGNTLKVALDKIAQINQFLGGNRLTLEGVKKLLQKNSSNAVITIVDVGCGNGDMLRKLADYGLKNNLNLELIGVDANRFTIDYAVELSANYDNIRYRCENVFSESFGEFNCDICLCTLFLHHFKNNEIIKLLKLFERKSRFGFVVNDLHRNSMAYRLFQLICFVFRMNKMSQEDGLTSILRGFKKEELTTFSENMKFKKYSIHWKWAFRYQWIVEK